MPDGNPVAVTVTGPQRDSTQRHFVCHLLPAQGLGVPCAPGINDRRVTHKMCCVIVPEASGMTTSREAVGVIAGSVKNIRASRASAKPRFLTPRRQSVGRGRRHDGITGALGDLPAACRRGVGLICFSSGVGQFRKRRCEPHRRVPECRESWTVAAIIADVLPVRSSRATARLGRAKPRDRFSVLFRGRARWLLTVSAVCDRRNEREHPA